MLRAEVGQTNFTHRKVCSPLTSTTPRGPVSISSSTGAEGRCERAGGPAERGRRPTSTPRPPSNARTQKKCLPTRVLGAARSTYDDRLHQVPPPYTPPLDDIPQRQSDHPPSIAINALGEIPTQKLYEVNAAKRLCFGAGSVPSRYLTRSTTTSKQEHEHLHWPHKIASGGEG